VALVVRTLQRIRVVPGLNLGPKSGYPSWDLPLGTNNGSITFM